MVHYELCTPDSEAVKAGYKNICEIGKERIRRAGEKIKADNAGKEGIDDLDIGFRVLKLDDTNMKDVYYAASEYTQDLLSMMEDNIKDDRTIWTCSTPAFWIGDCPSPCLTRRKR